MDLGERIQEQRKKQNFTQDQLAEKLDVSRQAVSKWESGQSVPDVDKIVEMSGLFDVTTDYLLKGSEPPAPPHDNGIPIFNDMRPNPAKIMELFAAGLIAVGAFIGWMSIYISNDTASMIIFIIGAVLQIIGIIGIALRKKVFPGERLSKNVAILITWLLLITVVYCLIPRFLSFFIIFHANSLISFIAFILLGILATVIIHRRYKNK